MKITQNTRLTQTDEMVVSMTVVYGAVLGLLVQGHPLDVKLSNALMQQLNSGLLPFHAVTSDQLQPPPHDPEPPCAGRFASPDALLTPSYMAADPDIRIFPTNPAAWPVLAAFGSSPRLIRQPNLTRVTRAAPSAFR